MEITLCSFSLLLLLLTVPLLNVLVHKSLLLVMHILTKIFGPGDLINSCLPTLIQIEKCSKITLTCFSLAKAWTGEFS